MGITPRQKVPEFDNKEIKAEVNNDDAETINLKNCPIITIIDLETK